MPSAAMPSVSSTQPSIAGLQSEATAASPAAESDVYAAQSSSQVSTATALQQVGPFHLDPPEILSQKEFHSFGVFDCHLTSNLTCAISSATAVKYHPQKASALGHDDRLPNVHFPINARGISGLFASSWRWHISLLRFERLPDTNLMILQDESSASTSQPGPEEGDAHQATSSPAGLLERQNSNTSASTSAPEAAGRTALTGTCTCLKQSHPVNFAFSKWHMWPNTSKLQLPLRLRSKMLIFLIVLILLI